VALCAVFFSLGFFVGYKERSPNVAPVTESVTPPPDATTPVSAPLEETQPGSTGGARAPANSAAYTSPSATQSQKSARDVDGSTPEPNPLAGTARKPPVTPGRSPSEAVGPDMADPVPTAGGVTVQVAALSNRQDAESLVGVLKTRGYAAFLMTPEQAGAHDKFFRIAVGPFKSTDAAEKAVSKLSGEGFKPFMKR
jgi:cell division septation protein DedD